MNAQKRRWLIILAVLSFLSGAFFVGSGLGKVAVNLMVRREYQDSKVRWRQELAQGAEGEEVRDRRNRELADNMKYVSINRVLHFAGKGGAEAGIAVDEKSDFGCIVTIVRDATGEALYQSGLIEPGSYIETILLDSVLRDGYYPCTAVWSYYAEGDEYVGETAWKVVVIVGE